jgi:hypothetical protein
MWPDVAQRLPASAPNLAPSKLISTANGLTVRTKDRPGRQPALRHLGPLADDRTGEDPPSGDPRDSQVLPGSMPPEPHSLAAPGP